ncbi:uncharacterized protein ARMOST_18096 [Armillaria ostoyae]|uniref:Uncharacterized protein n=1 Tax=Armillaria ostoyae TaxID=47428 RepID=A0A284S0U6_ARMOS|nr:uncharacterized protein ARMOST_18096 [Armillaria ostoyae]
MFGGCVTRREMNQTNNLTSTAIFLDLFASHSDHHLSTIAPRTIGLQPLLTRETEIVTTAPTEIDRVSALPKWIINLNLSSGLDAVLDQLNFNDSPLELQKSDSIEVVGVQNIGSSSTRET